MQLEYCTECLMVRMANIGFGDNCRVCNGASFQRVN